jgi:sigma-B regulation protein RsbU (phosphoserine phosphatase)
MSSGRSTLRALLPSTPHVLDLAEGMNRRIVEDAGASGMFITVVVGCYDPRSRDLALVNCGHPEPVLFHRAGRIECVPASSAPVGILDSLNADAFISTLGNGDLICLYTDGLTEAEGPGGERFGLERFHGLLTKHAGASLDEIADAILAAVIAFRGHETLEDDLTLMLLRRRVGTS